MTFGTPLELLRVVRIRLMAQFLPYLWGHYLADGGLIEMWVLFLIQISFKFAPFGVKFSNYFSKMLLHFIKICDWNTISMESQKITFSLRPSSSTNGIFRLSVCPSVRPSFRLLHLFHYVPIIVSSWNVQELLPTTKVRSMQKVKVKGQGHRGKKPT